MMRYKAEKRYLIVCGTDVERYIKCIMTARNAYIEKGNPIEDINYLLDKFIKFRKKMHVRKVKWENG